MTALSDAVVVHVFLAYCGFGMAVLAGIPLAVLSLRSRYAAILVSSITGIGQAIPIFALVAFMVPLVGIGFIPSIIVVFISTLLPIVRSTFAGIASVHQGLIDAANGIGLTWKETLIKVRIPLSWHAIFSGLKFSSIIANGVAVITVFIGSGGLGTIILRGLARFYIPEILTGIIPAIAIALIADYLLSRLEERVTPLPLRDGKPFGRYPDAIKLPRLP
jgi:osmoprotectant transport system permease protein